MRFLFALLFSTQLVFAGGYVRGDRFKTMADHHFLQNRPRFDPSLVKKGDLVFVQSHMLKRFFARHFEKIQEPFVLISHNSDDGVDETFLPYLEEKKLLAWFAQNVFIEHEKLFPIPIGLTNTYNRLGKYDYAFAAKMESKRKPKREIELYLNFSPSTHSSRKAVYDLLSKFPFTESGGRLKTPKGLGYNSYLYALQASKFVASPRGNGLDTHRTWEALMLGAIPIIESSAMDKMYKPMRVLIVKDWSVINHEFLTKAYESFNKKRYPSERLYMDYWINLIHKERDARLTSYES